MEKCYLNILVLHLRAQQGYYVSNYVFLWLEILIKTEIPKKF